MSLRVIIATRPLRLGNDAVIIDVVAKTISRGRHKFRSRGYRGISYNLLAAILLRSAGRHSISRDEIVHLIYGGDLDGGALCAANVVTNMMTHNCRRFAQLGLAIARPHGQRQYGIIDLWADEMAVAA